MYLLIRWEFLAPHLVIVQGVYKGLWMCVCVHHTHKLMNEHMRACTQLPMHVTHTHTHTRMHTHTHACMHAHTHTHTHTHYKCMHYWHQVGGKERKEMTNQYAI